MRRTVTLKNPGRPNAEPTERVVYQREERPSSRKASGEIDESHRRSRRRAGDALRYTKKRGTWLVKLHYTNHDGETDRLDEARLQDQGRGPGMGEGLSGQRGRGRRASTFEQFVGVYAEDVRPRLRETTWRSKEHMMDREARPVLRRDEGRRHHVERDHGLAEQTC